MSEFDKTPKRRARAPVFTATARLVQNHIRKTVQHRGFSEPRVITEWPRLVGDELAQMARPISVRFGKGEFGANLTLLCTGASAPLVEMQKNTILQKLNDVYGYGAIARITITQTAPVGFAEGQASFTYGNAAKPLQKPPVSDEIKTEAHAMAARVQSPELKKAIEDAAITFISTAAKNEKEAP